MAAHSCFWYPYRVDCGRPEEDRSWLSRLSSQVLLSAKMRLGCPTSGCLCRGTLCTAGVQLRPHGAQGSRPQPVVPLRRIQLHQHGLPNQK